jgi:UDP-glucose:(glucosyl)LPS alpha-1,2-glucosyltransferase
MPEVNELNKNAMGGTELMAHRIEGDCNQSLLSQFQLIHSRARELDEDKKNVLICHDLATDPEVQHLKDGGWKKYDKIVFVSHWQQEQYFMYLGVPYEAGTVLYNAIEPIPVHKKPDPKKQLNLIYFSTPHRGLDLLYAAFNQLAQEHDNIHLDVYSSFELYGWKQRDNQYKELFDLLKAHPNITYHRSVSNDEIRKALEKAHIFAYPSIWQETSCLCLIEALSAGLYCVHPALGALKETSIGLSQMYPFNDNVKEHVNNFYVELKKAILIHEKNYKYVQRNTQTTKAIADFKFDWNQRKYEWNELLKSLAGG